MTSPKNPKKRLPWLHPHSCFAGIVLATWVSSLVPVARAGPAGFYRSGREGWFWYRDTQQVERMQTRETTILPPSPGGGGQSRGPRVFSAAWLRENIPKFRDMAIDNPTPENTAAYFALQRLAMDKAERFARTARMLPVLYPALDENVRRPTATAAAFRLDSESARMEDEILRRIAGFAGIFFFFQSTCPHCIAQVQVLKVLERQYGFDILPISIDGNPLISGDYPKFRADSGQAQALGVTATPAMFLVRPETGSGYRIQPLGQGEMALTQLKRRILDVSLEAGWIDRESYEKTLPVRPVYLDGPQDAIAGKTSLQIAGQGDPTPEEVLKLLGIAPGPRIFDGF